jgi:hypothetical protein
MRNGGGIASEDSFHRSVKLLLFEVMGFDESLELIASERALGYREDTSQIINNCLQRCLPHIPT